jgi:hypothetical protein
MFKFVPITSLLTGIPGSGYLSHAINLYLRCKSRSLYFFLEFLLHFSLPTSRLTALFKFSERSSSECYFLKLIFTKFICHSDKPDPHELQHFLEFQVPLQWAPMFNELVLGPQKRKGSYPSLQFRFLGPKLRVSTSKVPPCLFAIVGLFRKSLNKSELPAENGMN